MVAQWGNITKKYFIITILFALYIYLEAQKFSKSTESWTNQVITEPILIYRISNFLPIYDCIVKYFRETPYNLTIRKYKGLKSAIFSYYYNFLAPE